MINMNENTSCCFSESEPVKKVQENTGLDIRVGTSNDLMMDKMKTEQDNALNFIRLCIITQYCFSI